MNGSVCNRQITRGTYLAILGLAGAWPSAALSQNSPDVAWFGGGGGAGVMAVSSDGMTIATSTILNEKALKLWHVDGTFVRTLPAFTPYWCAAFSPDGQYVVGGRAGLAGDTTATASIFRVSDGALLQGLNPGFENNLNLVYGVDYAPGGDLVAVTYDNYSVGIKLYNPTTGALVRTLAEGGYVAKFSPDGQMIAGVRSGGVRLWRVSDGATLMTLPFGAGLLAFSADGQHLALASAQQDWPVRIFRTSDGGLEQTITPSLVQIPRSIAFAPNQNMLVIAGSRDAAVPIPEFNLYSDETIQAYNLDGSAIWSYYHTYGIAFSIGFTPNGQYLMVAGGWATPVPNYVEGGDDSIQRLRASDGVEVAHFSGRRGLAFGVGFSPDSRLFASGGNTMQIWNVADGTIAHTFGNGANSVAFSPDGTKLVAAAGGIQIWNIPGYNLLQTLPDPGANQAVISNDGTLIGAGGGLTARLWRVADGALLWTRPSNAGTVETVAISPDGQILAAGCSGSTVRLWRTSDGVLLNSIVGQNVVDSIAFSPDGTLLAVGEAAYLNNLKLYNVSNGSLAHAFPGSWGGEHQSVAFTPDGTKIVFSSGAQYIQFWRISDGALLQEYNGEAGTGYFPWMPVAVSPDGRYVGYGRQDAMVVMARNPFVCPANVALPPDGQVNVNDLLLVITSWGQCPAPPASCSANIVNTGGSFDRVDIDDLLAVISGWGACP